MATLPCKLIGVPSLAVCGAIALSVGGASALSSFYAGDRAVLLSTGAVPLEQIGMSAPEADKLKFRQLENVVDEMSIAAGLRRP